MKGRGNSISYQSDSREQEYRHACDVYRNIDLDGTIRASHKRSKEHNILGYCDKLHTARLVSMDILHQTL